MALNALTLKLGHIRTYIKGFMDKSATAEYTWTEDHPIRWDDTRIMQHASRIMELVIKEAICIQTAPESSHFSRDGGYDIAESPHTRSEVEPTQGMPT